MPQLTLLRDEDAPLMIEDETAVQPVDWLDDEPARIPDPNAQKPAEWCVASKRRLEMPRLALTSRRHCGGRDYPRSDEDDGEWEAPLIRRAPCNERSMQLMAGTSRSYHCHLIVCMTCCSQPQVRTGVGLR